jgi:hypothetical protein
MTRFTLPITSLATLLICAFSAMPAEAQTRVFVAAQGSDSNPCTFASPCRTFQHAHDVLAAGSEIDVLDPAGYGALNITKSISIQGHGFSGISATSGTAISITIGTTDEVNLRALLLDGVGTGATGISIHSAGSVSIQDSVIRNFTGDSIVSAPSTGTSKLLVTNALLAKSNNGFRAAATGSGSVTGAFDRVIVNNMSGDGFFVNGTLSSGTIAMTINQSVIEFCDDAVFATSIAPASTTVMVQGSTLVNNRGAGLRSDGVPTIVRVSGSTLTGNAETVPVQNGGTIESFGNNVMRGNNGNGTPMAVLLQ